MKIAVRSSLRPYQKQAATKSLTLLRQGRAVLLVSPTGAGKTRIAAAIAKRFRRVLVVAHRQEIIDQAAKAMGPNVISMSVQSALRYGPKSVDLLIIDEAHRSAASTYRALIEKYTSAARLGLTATPIRTDGQGLCDAFDEIVLASNIAELVSFGHLVPYRAFEAPDEALKQLAHMKRQCGDWKTADLNALMNTPRLVGDVVREYKKHGMGRKAVAFAVSVEHSRKLTEAFLDAGIRAVHIDGRASDCVRRDSLRSLSDGRVDVLCNVNLFTEGWDCPAVSCVIMARPTASLTLYRQSVGRGMRPHHKSGKTDLLILDHAGNIERHGAPDKHIDWSLESDAQRAKREAEIRELERLNALGFDSLEAELEEKQRLSEAFMPASQAATLLSVPREVISVVLKQNGIFPVNGNRSGRTSYLKVAVERLATAMSDTVSPLEAADMLSQPAKHISTFLKLRNVRPSIGNMRTARYSKGQIEQLQKSISDRRSCLPGADHIWSGHGVAVSGKRIMRCRICNKSRRFDIGNG